MLAALIALLATTAASASAAVCTIQVPADPLSAKGLATPYLVSGCDQANADQTSFVQGAVYDPNAKTLFVYNPLVINMGTQPAVAPVVPKLPPGAIVGLWFGTNSAAIHLTGPGVKQGNCVNGLSNSDFGQFAACNAEAFFAAAQNAKDIPTLGTARDGEACPTVRDFSIVDQDQSDNVVTNYIIAKDGRLAQNTAANRAKLGTTIVENGSDNLLLVRTLEALGCKPFVAPDLADPGNSLPALPLNELQAQKFQRAPVAVVPIDDPMVLVDGKQSAAKTTLYRKQVFQRVADANNDGAAQYCKEIIRIAPTRLAKGKPFKVKAASLNADVGNTLFSFLAARLQTTLGPDGLNCLALLKVTSPVVLQKDAKGVAIDASFVPSRPAGEPTPTTKPGPKPTMTPAPKPTCASRPPKHTHKPAYNKRHRQRRAY
ncbi:hypothetical protein HK105_206202 [Polyrhizophydium stewartii]|uniref:Uncharacterized protein n=1 Tax=Polyrhizophydium stewartii TaxID=2732419 RepID=A0ABR4N404_9FUNG|nr:hypothetical protein HK105_002309 [Polyrhizophydium stewartii]